jgi:hypothetical protein
MMVSDATDRAKQLLSTLDRESAVAFSSVRGVLKECIAEIERLEAEIKCLNGELFLCREQRLAGTLRSLPAVQKAFEDLERLRGALEPFAKAHDAMLVPGMIIDPYDHITLHDLRMAAEALKENEDE